MFPYLLLIFTTLLSGVLLKVIYNHFFHPLRDFPGPWYCGASRLWYAISGLCGTLQYDVKKLHDEFGDTVRIAPDELSYNTPEAWQPIYGRNLRSVGNSPPKSELFKKDPVVYGVIFNDQQTLLNAEGDIYKPQKKNISTSFSPKALQVHEETVSKYASVMKSLINEQLESSKARSINLSSLIGNVNMDISTTFVLGESHGAAKRELSLHPLISSMDSVLKFMQLVSYLIPHNIDGIVSYAAPFLKERLQKEDSHIDLMSKIVGKDDGMADKGASSNALAQAAFVLLAAMETTPKFLIGTLYHMLANPETYAQAAAEIRQQFKAVEEMSFASTQNLSYLNACMSEALRMYPPIAFSSPRQVSAGGAEICGRFVPGNVTVGVSHWATYRSTKNFKNPDSYKPERWLDSEVYTGDRLDGVHAFSFGPRICIAKDYALKNSRYLLSRLLWEFDMELAPESKSWDRQKGFVVWSPSSLNVVAKKRSQ